MSLVLNGSVLTMASSASLWVDKGYSGTIPTPNGRKVDFWLINSMVCRIPTDVWLFYSMVCSKSLYLSISLSTASPPKKSPTNKTLQRNAGIEKETSPVYAIKCAGFDDRRRAKTGEIRRTPLPVIPGLVAKGHRTNWQMVPGDHRLGLVLVHLLNAPFWAPLLCFTHS